MRLLLPRNLRFVLVEYVELVALLLLHTLHTYLLPRLMHSGTHAGVN